MNIIELAREAGLSIRGHYDETGSTPQELERFAKLVRNATLEEAAEYLENVHRTRLVKFAGAIRAMKEQT